MTPEATVVTVVGSVKTGGIGEGLASSSANAAFASYVTINVLGFNGLKTIDGAVPRGRNTTQLLVAAVFRYQVLHRVEV